MTAKKKINKKFKIARITKGLTQKELAEKIGVTPRTIQLYESGTSFPSVCIAKKISDLFEQPIEEIFFAN